MSISGNVKINIGLPNEAANSDSLYTAFNKVNDNFDILFAQSNPNLVAGNNITITSGPNNSIVISSPTGGVGATGATGLTGATGANGTIGVDGSTGATGATGPVGPIAGTNTQVLFNDSGVANGSSNFTYDKNNVNLTLGNAVGQGNLNLYGAITIGNVSPDKYANIKFTETINSSPYYGFPVTAAGEGVIVITNEEATLNQAIVLMDSSPGSPETIFGVSTLVQPNGGPTTGYESGWQRVIDIRGTNVFLTTVGSGDAANTQNILYYTPNSGLVTYAPKPADGSTGATGLTGATGPSGGPTGATGATGLQILNGSGPPSIGLGVIGDFYIDINDYELYGPKFETLLGVSWGSPKSLIGATGSPGGATGATGLTGATGPSGGPTGATGSTGPIGIQGPAGSQGPSGATGLTGATGSTYQSISYSDLEISTGNKIVSVSTGLAYSVGQKVIIANAVNQLMTGTVTNYNILNGQLTVDVSEALGSGIYTYWVVNLYGAIGPQGSTGATGAGSTGATGVAGVDGATGLTGATGETGATGAGIDGATGATGPAGDVGATGVEGVDGATGATGPAGSNGTDGATGSTGPQGDTGATGTAGVDGSTGATGVAGPTGATGPAGTNGIDGATGLTGATGSTGPVGATGVAGPIAGSNTQIIFNDAGAANGSANLTFDKTTNILTIGGTGGNITGANLISANFVLTDNLQYANGTPYNVTGATGPQGSTGATGVAGPTGATGVAGNNGATGATGPAGPVGGSNTQVLFNDGGVANGVANLVFNKTTSNLTVDGNVITGTGTGGNITGANVISANLFTGTLTTAAQPNITSVGTLSSLTVTGNITSGNVYANSGTIGSTTLDVSGNATVGGTGSNIIRRAYGLVASDVAVTLDDLQVSVTSSTSQLKLQLTTGSWQGTGWTETFTTGSSSVSSWVNLPLGSGFSSASGAMTSQGNGCKCVISDQTPTAKVYEITVVRSGTTGNQWNICITRLV